MDAAWPRMQCTSMHGCTPASQGPAASDSVRLRLAQPMRAAAKRVRPIVAGGHEQTGEVVAVQFGVRRKAGMNLYRESITVRTVSGETIHAALEESEGTPLPAVEPGATAVVWTLDGASVVGTSGSLFESAAPPRPGP